MGTIAGSALIALSFTMLIFGQIKGYMLVSRPKYRVYRAQQPAYFWTLIAGHSLVGAVGIRILYVNA